MSALRLASRERRAVLALAFIAVPAGAWRLVIDPLLAWRSDMIVRVEHERLLLGRERMDLSSEQTYRTRLAELRGRVAREERMLLAAASVALVEAAAVDYVRTVAELSGVQLRSADALPGDSVAAEIGSIRLRLSGDATFEALAVFLRRMEAGPGRVIAPGILLRATPVSADEGAGVSLEFELAVAAHYTLSSTGHSPEEPLRRPVASGEAGS